QSFISARAAEYIAVSLILLLAIANAIRLGLGVDTGLAKQTRQFRSVSDLLGADGLIYVHGATEILAVLDRPNLNPYIFLDNNKDEYLATRMPGGFDAVIDRMESAAPKVIILSGLNRVAHRKELQAWAESHYEKLPSMSDEIGYDAYVRRP